MSSRLGSRTPKTTGPCCGIRYATARRFHTPVRYTTHSDYHPEAPVCCPGISTNLSQEMGGEVQQKTEDCLTLDIWIPEKVEQKDLPVWIWIPGGNFIVGSGNQPRFNAQQLANSTKSIIVSINYRVGIFGWPPYHVLPNVPLGTQDVPARNLGLHDIHAAVYWIKKHIHHYGGNARNILLTGQSAGAFLALDYARSSTDKDVSGLILFGTPLGMPKRIPKLARRASIAHIEKLATGPMDKMQNKIEKRWKSFRLFSYFRPTLPFQVSIPTRQRNTLPPILAVFNKDEASAWINDQTPPNEAKRKIQRRIKRLASITMTYLLFQLPWHILSRKKITESCMLIRLDLTLDNSNQDIRTEHCMEIPVIFQNEDNDAFLERKNIPTKVTKDARREMNKLLSLWTQEKKCPKTMKYLQRII